MDKIQDWVAILTKRGFAYDDDRQESKYCRMIGGGAILEAFASGKYIRVSGCSDTEALFEIYPGPLKSAFYNRNWEFSKRLSHGRITERLKKL